MTVYRCECGNPLFELPDDATHLIRFPQDLLHCYAVLSRGPGAAMCQRCQHINTFGFLSMVVQPGRGVVVGVPEGNAAAAKLAEDVPGIFAELDPNIQLTVTHTKREFKRACLLSFVNPAIVLLNEFVLAENEFSWVLAHEAQLDHAFFSSLWLVASGAVQVFSTELSKVEQPVRPSYFVPHEHAPDTASNLISKHETLRRNAVQAGRLLGTLLLRLALKAVERRQLVEFHNCLLTLLPEGLLDEVMTQSVAQQIEDIVGFIYKLEGASIALPYVLELGLAVLCHTADCANPRRRQWTEAALMYDIARRRDGGDEALLLSPELMQKTLDETHFWNVFNHLGMTSGLATLTEENKQELIWMLESAGRIYPDEMATRARFEIREEEGVMPNVSLANSKKRIRNALEAENPVFMLRLVLRHLQSSAPALLPEATGFAIEEMAANGQLESRDQCALLAMMIEALNDTRHDRQANIIADHLSELLVQANLIDRDPTAASVALNEIGNCRRLSRMLPEALALYDQSLALAGKDIKHADTRVAMRNRAIVLREMHHYKAAVAACQELMPYASSTEARALAVTEATCLVEMGQSEQARELLEQMAPQLAGERVDERNVLSFVGLLGFLRAQDGHIDAARAVLAPAISASKQKQYSVVPLVADFVELMYSQREDGVDIAAGDVAIDSLYDTMLHVSGRSMNWLVMSIVVALDRALFRRGASDRAEHLLRVLVERADLQASPRCWQLHLLAGAHAAQRLDRQKYRSDIVASMRDFQAGLANAAAADDIATYSSPQGEAAAHLVAKAIALFGDSGTQEPALVLYAADLRSAPVATSRLRTMAALPPVMADPVAEQQRVHRLLQETPAVTLQFVGDGEHILLVRSALDDNGNLATQVRRLAPGQKEVEKIVKRLRFALKNTTGSVPDLSYPQVAGWRELADELAASTADIEDGLPAFVVAGPVQEAAISLAIGDRRPLCFVPSIAALVGLRMRRWAETASTQWRPRRLFTFAAWFDREYAEQIAALNGVASAGEALASAYGLESDHATGLDATRERLLEGLERADLAWLACHGRIRAGAESVDLYVAAAGNLPCADLASIDKRYRDAHLVNWQELARPGTAPRVVISSACDSGLSTTNAGGERLGLERSLFAAGASVLAAPLWPVPTREIQDQVAIILRLWLSDPGTSLATHIWHARRNSSSAGMPRLASEAFGVFGDALYNQGGNNGNIIR